jgi:hypothetical protein
MSQKALLFAPASVSWLDLLLATMSLEETAQDSRKLLLATTRDLLTRWSLLSQSFSPREKRLDMEVVVQKRLQLPVVWYDFDNRQNDLKVIDQYLEKSDAGFEAKHLRLSEFQSGNFKDLPVVAFYAYYDEEKFGFFSSTAVVKALSDAKAKTKVAFLVTTKKTGFPPGYNIRDWKTKDKIVAYDRHVVMARDEFIVRDVLEGFGKIRKELADEKVEEAPRADAGSSDLINPAVFNQSKEETARFLALAGITAENSPGIFGGPPKDQPLLSAAPRKGRKTLHVAFSNGLVKDTDEPIIKTFFKDFSPPFEVKYLTMDEFQSNKFENLALVGHIEAGVPYVDQQLFDVAVEMNGNLFVIILGKDEEVVRIDYDNGLQFSGKTGRQQNTLSFDGGLAIYYKGSTTFVSTGNEKMQIDNIASRMS